MCEFSQTKRSVKCPTAANASVYSLRPNSFCNYEHSSRNILMRFVAYDSENFKVLENATKKFRFFDRLKVVTPLKRLGIAKMYAN